MLFKPLIRAFKYFVVDEGNPVFTVITLDSYLRYLGVGSDRTLDLYICS
uniref:Uncharacterized protein n=1 Tax=Lepeophtheirus salmonis TaxID=72036 RepID=A0A0K2UTU8_LEPSM